MTGAPRRCNALVQRSRHRQPSPPRSRQPLPRMDAWRSRWCMRISGSRRSLAGQPDLQYSAHFKGWWTPSPDEIALLRER